MDFRFSFGLRFRLSLGRPGVWVGSILIGFYCLGVLGSGSFRVFRLRFGFGSSLGKI